jgi:CheY-like chemotaxis protein
MKRAYHHILVVDDDQSQQFFSERALNKALSNRSTVHIASSGNQAIAYMIGEGEFSDRERYPFPTLVITDLNMPDGDGFDVLEFMRCNPEWSVVPRVMFSSSDEDDDVRTAYVLGASAYHTKSVGSDLEECMRQIIQYWTSCRVPPVDKEGRLLTTRSFGGPGRRYEQPQGGEKMKRPDEVAPDAPGRTPSGRSDQESPR